MLVEALVALALGSCPALYGHTDNVTIAFSEGSAELPATARRQLSEVLQPIIGDELAEAEVSARFPYGAGEPAIALAQARVDALRDAAIDLGLSPDLIGTSISAFRRAADRDDLPSPRLETVDISVRVKTDCHPLADLARRMNPYR